MAYTGILGLTGPGDFALSALDQGSTTARLSKIDIEALRQGPGNARLTKVSAEILRQGPGNARLSKLDAEVLRQGPGAARLTKISVEVLRTTTASYQNSVSFTGTNTLTFTILATFVPTLTLSATDTLSFTILTTFNITDLTFSSTNTFTLTPNNVVSVSDIFSSTNTLTLTPNNVVSVSDTFSSTNTFTLTPNNVVSVSDTFSSTNTFTLTPNNVVSVSDTFSGTNIYSTDVLATFEISETFSSTDTLTLIPNNVISLSESLSSTNTYSTDMLVTFETSDSFTETNSFSLTPNNDINTSYTDSETADFVLTPNNVIETDYDDSETATFTLTPNNDINTNYSDSETADFVLAPNNVIGSSFDLDSIGEFNEDTEADDEVELNLFVTNTFDFTSQSDFNPTITFIEINSIAFDYVYVPGSHTPTTFNDIITFIRDADLSANISVRFNVQVDFREDYDILIDGNVFEPEFATISTTANVDYAFSVNYIVISNAVFTPNLVIDSQVAFAQAADAVFSAITNIYKSVDFNAISAFVRSANIKFNLKLELIPDTNILFALDGDYLAFVNYGSTCNYSLFPNLVVDTVSTHSSVSNVIFSAFTSIYKAIVFNTTDTLAVTNTVNYQLGLNFGHVAGLSLLPNNVINISASRLKTKNKITNEIDVLFVANMLCDGTSNLILNVSNSLNKILGIAGNNSIATTAKVTWGTPLILTNINQFHSTDSIDYVITTTLEYPRSHISIIGSNSIAQPLTLTAHDSIIIQPFVLTGKSISFAETADYQLLPTVTYRTGLHFEASNNVLFVLTQDTSGLTFNQAASYQSNVSIVLVPSLILNNSPNISFYGQGFGFSFIPFDGTSSLTTDLNTDFNPLIILFTSNNLQANVQGVFEASLTLSYHAGFYQQMSKSTDHGAWFFQNIVRKG